MEDSITESFVLKVEMFDVAQKAFRRKLGAEQAVQPDRREDVAPG